jgi:hypothetical protein
MEAQQLATKQGHKLLKAELKAAVEAVLPLIIAPVAAGFSPAPGLGFDSLRKEWIIEHSHRPRAGTDKPLSALAAVGLKATRARFTQYVQARGVALLPEALGLRFTSISKEAFNHCVGIDRLRLLKYFMCKSVRRRAV